MSDAEVSVRHNHPSDRSKVLKWVVGASVAVYVVLDIIAQLLPPHYSVLHQPESDLGVGPYAGIMNTNFVIRGISGVAVAALLGMGHVSRRQKAGLWLVATWGVCSALLSVFPTDISGSLGVATAHGAVHLVLAVTGFLAAAVGVVLFSSRSFRKPRAMRIIITATAAALVVFIVAAAETDLFGLFERVFIATVLVWTIAAATTSNQGMSSTVLRGCR